MNHSLKGKVALVTGASRGIPIRIPSPGPAETELFTAGKAPEEIQTFASLAALGRLGQPADIAEVAALLASDAAGWMTGQNLRVNGGMV